MVLWQGCLSIGLHYVLDNCSTREDKPHGSDGCFTDYTAVAVENRFHGGGSATGDRYCDMLELVDLRMKNGFIVEMQFHNRTMFDAKLKGTGGHVAWRADELL